MVDYQVQFQTGAMMPTQFEAGGFRANGYAHDFTEEARWIVIADDVLAELKSLREDLHDAIAEMRHDNREEFRRVDQVIRGDNQYQGVLGRLQKLEDNMMPKSAIESLQKDRDRHEQSVIWLRATLFSMIGTGIVGLLVAGAAHFLHW